MCNIMRLNHGIEWRPAQLNQILELPVPRVVSVDMPLVAVDGATVVYAAVKYRQARISDTPNRKDFDFVHDLLKDDQSDQSS